MTRSGHSATNRSETSGARRLLRATLRAILPAALLLPGLSSNAQTASYAPPSSDPQELHVFKGHVYFSADDGVHGRELWRATARGEVELVADITPGAAGTTLSDFADYGDALLFRVDPADAGSELWRTDGTAEGTRRLAQFDAVLGFHFDGVIGVAADGRACFRVVAETTQLWVTDGTPEGTRALELNMPDGAAVSVDYAALMHQGQVFFSGAESGQLPGLFRYSIETGVLNRVTALDSPETDLLALDESRLLFRGARDGLGMELMITDGTPEGTRILTDIAPGVAPSFPNAFALIESSFTHSATPTDRFVPVPNQSADRLVIFSADDGTHGVEPWITNGTPEGTRMLSDIYTGKESSVAYDYKVYGDRIIFKAKSEGTGRELWFTTRPFETATLLADVYPGPTGSDPYSVCTLLENKTVFSALDPSLGEELFFGSATAREARLQMDIYPGPESSYPYWTVLLEDRVIFAATDPVHGRELWYMDQAGHVALLADIYSDASTNPSSSPSQLTPAGEHLYFVCNDIAHGAELWITDGTDAGTRLVKDIFPGAGSSAPGELTPLGGLLYFSAEDGTGPARLWQSDGTADGTRLVESEGESPLHLFVLGDTLYFSATRAEDGRELWAVGPGRAAARVRDIAPGPTSSGPRNFTVFQGLLYFLADDGVRGEELWRSDGTDGGTVLVRDVVSVPYEKIGYDALAPAAGHLYFAGGGNTQGLELWRYTGGTDRPSTVKDIATWESASGAPFAAVE